MCVRYKTVVWEKVQKRGSGTNTKKELGGIAERTKEQKFLYFGATISFLLIRLVDSLMGQMCELLSNARLTLHC